MEKGPKILMQMLYYYMLFIIYLHIIACLWFLFCEETYKLSKNDSRYQAWIPPYDFYDGNDNFWERYEAGDEIFLYLVCLYYSVLVIGGNEMGPKELPEIVFMVIINLIFDWCYLLGIHFRRAGCTYCSSWPKVPRVAINY